LNKANILKNLGKIHQLAFDFVMAERKKTIYLTAAMKLALINSYRELNIAYSNFLIITLHEKLSHMFSLKT
jgi:hypothetical protein